MASSAGLAEACGSKKFHPIHVAQRFPEVAAKGAMDHGRLLANIKGPGFIESAIRSL